MRPTALSAFAIGALLAACGPSATATPPATATPEATTTPTVTATPLPSPTEIPPTATATAEATASPSPTRPPSPAAPATAAATAAPTAEGAAASDPPAAATGGDGQRAAITGDSLPLKVSYTDIHYECHKACMGDGIWTYRYLQVLMVVENNVPDLTIEAPWAPSRWIVTDGARDWAVTDGWEWTQSGHPPPPQPNVAPGARVEWTWITAPIPPGAWVKAIEFDIDEGHTLRQNLPQPGPSQNYVECGEPREGNC